MFEKKNKAKVNQEQFKKEISVLSESKTLLVNMNFGFSNKPS